MTLLASNARTLVERAALLREAVRVGLRLWGAQLTVDEHRPDRGGDEDPHAFLCAVLSYAATLHDAGHRHEAAQCLRFVLVLDPSDRVDADGTLTRLGFVQAAWSRPPHA